MKTEQPDWIYLDEEPWSMVTQQVAWINHGWRKVPLMFHTNQNIKKNFPFPFSWFEWWIFRTAAHAFPVGSEAARVLRDKGYKKPLTIFPYGIDETLYYPHHQEARELRGEYRASGGGRFVFGYLGRFVEEKGLKDLIQAFHSISYLYQHAILWLVGDGPQRDELFDFATTLGLKPPVFQIIASVNHESASEVLSAMDVCILPSRTRPFWKEQFGRVIIEALACGTPVIGSDSGEIPHLIEDLGGGLVFPEGNIEALANAMEEILTNHELCLELAETGMQNVMARYTNAQLAHYFHQVLETFESPEGSHG